MDFAFSEEQNQLRETVVQFLRDNSATTEVRKQMDSKRGFDQDVWKTFGNELGFGGIHVPEEYGGAGLSYVETCIVLEEMGRHLFCSPFLSSNILAVNALLCADESQKSRYLPDLVACKVIGTVALIEEQARWDFRQFECTARNGVLNGEKSFVTDGMAADLLFVAARDASTEELGFYRVDADAEGINRRPLESLDPTRRIAHITFQDVPASKFAALSEDSYENFLAQAIVALANEMVGGAQKMLDSALEYSSTRVQFGRTIGSYQAIKHKCAEMLLEIEFAKSAAYRAASSISQGEDDRVKLASVAKAVASDTYMNAASQCIQIHGGLGFTWENDTHLWYKRAKSSEVFLGDATYHREYFLQVQDI